MNVPVRSTESFLAYRQARLEMEGVALDALVARFGTPFFLISERRLLDNYQALARGLGAAGVAVTLRYCAKTNNEAGILRILARAGSSLLASHLAEVELALRCGFQPSRIAYQRPAPPAAEVEAVLAAGVECVHVFRPGELEPMAALAKRGGHRIRLSLRLRDERRMRFSPLASLNRRMGLSAAEARDVALACRGDEWLRVAALNSYVGTQQTRFGAFERGLRHACDLAHRLAVEGVASIEEINLGGGIPSASLRRLSLRQLWSRWRDRARGGGELSHTPERLGEFARRLGERYRMIAAAAGLESPPALAAEPGRSIVGNAAVLVTRVASVDGRWLFLDASRNFLGESPLLFSRRLVPLRERPVSDSRFVHLSGSTLNTTDVLDLWRRLPILGIGDALAFCDAGAYSISRASRYAGMAPAVVLLGADGTARPIRRPEDVSDLAGPMASGLAQEGPR